MSRITPAFVLLVALTAIASPPIERADSARQITESNAVLAIYVEDWGLASSDKPKLILAVWGDGHCVWSEDRVHGGPPLRSGQVRPERFEAFVTRMEKDGVFADKKLAQGHFGPDAQFTTILLRSSKQQLKMQSWHEVFEADGKAVATKSGIRPLNERHRLEVLQKEPADYLYYRFVWGEIRASASALIPNDSTPISGEVLMKAGVMSWSEKPTAK